MPHDFSIRVQDLLETIDDPDCDRELLFNTYRQLRLVNRVVSGWPGIYRTRIRPRLRRGETSTLLDIGCGGGDVARDLCTSAQADGFDLRVLAVDQDPRALAFAARRPAPAGLEFANLTLSELLRQGRAFDFVITNSVLHHVPTDALPEFRTQVEHATRGLALMNDVRRSRTAYTLFASIAPLFLRRSFSVSDGLLSVRRSYTDAELGAALGPRWNVARAGLHRLLASWTP